jgi:hypothetical protein
MHLFTASHHESFSPIFLPAFISRENMNQKTSMYKWEKNLLCILANGACKKFQKNIFKTRNCVAIYLQTLYYSAPARENSVKEGRSGGQITSWEKNLLRLLPYF